MWTQKFFRISRAFPVLSNVPATVPRRLLFSERYLGIDEFRRKQNAARLRVGDEARLKQRIHDDFVQSGVKNLFTEDIEKLINLAETDDDVALLGDILKAGLADPSRAMGASPMLLKRYFTVCKMLNSVDKAKEMWNDPGTQSSGFLDSMKVRRRFFSLLFDNGLYQELADCVKNNYNPEDLDGATMGIAALYKIGTPEAFENATEIVRKPPLSETKRFSKGTRGHYIYCLFAMKVGEYGIAYDLLTDRNKISRPTRLSSNMKLSILVEVNRLEDAMVIIRTELLPVESDDDETFRKRTVCFDVMRKLTEKVNEAGREDMAKELTMLLKALDETAELTNESLEQMVFSPIDPAGLADIKKERRKLRRKSSRRSLREEED